MSNNPTHDDNLPTWEEIMANLDAEIARYDDGIHKAVAILLGINK